MKMTSETTLEQLSYLIVRGDFPENICVDADKAHIMPRDYMDGVMKEDLNRLDNDTEYNSKK